MQQQRHIKNNNKFDKQKRGTKCKYKIEREIEELTLYLIELKKENEEMKNI